jgi:hypothetical protein
MGFKPGNHKGINGLDSVQASYLWFKRHAYMRRARIKNLEFALTDAEFIKLVTSNCYYCGKSWRSETRKVHKNVVPMLTIDRMDSEKGYLVENCVSACKRCNTIKMDIPYSEWVDHLKQIIHTLAQK